VVPSVAEIRAAFNARRGTAGLLEQTVRRLLGIDLKMKQYAQGSAFVRAVVDAAGMATFNRVWAGPEMIPTKDELLDPERWLVRAGGASAAGGVGEVLGPAGDGGADEAGGALAAGG
jgi:putative hydrolase